MEAVYTDEKFSGRGLADILINKIYNNKKLERNDSFKFFSFKNYKYLNDKMNFLTNKNKYLN